MKRRGFLGALAALVAAPKAMGAKWSNATDDAAVQASIDAPTPFMACERCGKPGERRTHDVTSFVRVDRRSPAYQPDRWGVGGEQRYFVHIVACDDCNAHHWAELAAKMFAPPYYFRAPRP